MWVGEEGECSYGPSEALMQTNHEEGGVLGSRLCSDLSGCWSVECLVVVVGLGLGLSRPYCCTVGWRG